MRMTESSHNKLRTMSIIYSPIDVFRYCWLGITSITQLEGTFAKLFNPDECFSREIFIILTSKLKLETNSDGRAMALRLSS